MHEILLLFLEKVCEAIFFSMFLILGKNLKEKRLLFTAIMIFDYLALTHILQFNTWFQLIYTFMSFINLKVLYKEKAQITDIFLFAAASIILMIICGISYFAIYFTIKNYYVSLILSRIMMIIFLILFGDKINKKYTAFYSLWNRHSKPNKIRSLTLRNISIILFNIMFYFINLVMGLFIILGWR